MYHDALWLLYTVRDDLEARSNAYVEEDRSTVDTCKFRYIRPVSVTDDFQGLLGPSCGTTDAKHVPSCQRMSVARMHKPIRIWMTLIDSHLLGTYNHCQQLRQ
jgi:hypothetical protein